MISLLYHDVVPAGRFEASGFSSPDADVYKFEAGEFRRHLLTIAARKTSDLRITFDDGGASALDPIAALLEDRGWRGHFFIPTDWIGRKGFLDANGIRELHRRGHTIGSHSCSHPKRMAACTHPEMLREWAESCRKLSDIVGAPVDTASVPGGYYSTRVAEAAAEAGVKRLWTSEPTERMWVVGNVQVYGRYSIRQGVSAETAAAIAAGDFAPRFRQALYWNAKKILKLVGGRHWIRFREAFFARREQS